MTLRKAIALGWTVLLVCAGAGVTAAQEKDKLTNSDLVAMLKAEIPETVIITSIKNSSGDLDRSAGALIELKNAGASPKILDAVAQSRHPAEPAPPAPVEPAGTKPATAEDDYRLAVRSMKLEDYAAAKKWAGKALELDQENGDYYLLRAQANEQLADNQGVIDDCAYLLKLDPKDGQALGMRGLAKLRERDYKGAIRDFTTAIKWDPKNGYLYTGRGQAYAASNDLKTALSDLDRALKLQPDDLSAYKARGAVKFKLDDLYGAQTDLDSADPHDPDVPALKQQVKAAITQQEMAHVKNMWGDYVRTSYLDLHIRKSLGPPDKIDGNRWWYYYDYANQPGWIDFDRRRVIDFRVPAWN